MKGGGSFQSCADRISFIPWEAVCWTQRGDEAGPERRLKHPGPNKPLLCRPASLRPLPLGPHLTLGVCPGLLQPSRSS